MWCSAVSGRTARAAGPSRRHSALALVGRVSPRSRCPRPARAGAKQNAPAPPPCLRPTTERTLFTEQGIFSTSKNVHVYVRTYDTCTMVHVHVLTRHVRTCTWFPHTIIHYPAGRASRDIMKARSPTTPSSKQGDAAGSCCGTARRCKKQLLLRRRAASVPKREP